MDRGGSCRKGYVLEQNTSVWSMFSFLLKLKSSRIALGTQSLLNQFAEAPVRFGAEVGAFSLSRARIRVLDAVSISSTRISPT